MGCQLAAHSGVFCFDFCLNTTIQHQLHCTIARTHNVVACWVWPPSDTCRSFPNTPALPKTRAPNHRCFAAQGSTQTTRGAPTQSCAQTPDSCWEVATLRPCLCRAAFWATGGSGWRRCLRPCRQVCAVCVYKFWEGLWMCVHVWVGGTSDTSTGANWVLQSTRQPAVSMCPAHLQIYQAWCLDNTLLNLTS